MKSDKLRDWLEILGIFSVVASLIFVGLQMRQAHKISLSQAYQARTATAAEWSSAFAANPVAISAFVKAVEGRDNDITSEEYETLRRTLIGVLHLYDNAHYQYQAGFVSEEFWAATQSNLLGWLRHETTRAIVLERLDAQGRPEFKAVVRAMDDELRSGARQ